MRLSVQIVGLARRELLQVQLQPLRLLIRMLMLTILPLP